MLSSMYGEGWLDEPSAVQRSQHVTILKYLLTVQRKYNKLQFNPDARPEEMPKVCGYVV